MDRMGDIVWMIKPGETEASSLKQRMERFAYEICSSRNIETSINLDALEKLKLSMEQRKNLYLIFKEGLNNAVKYSGAEKIAIDVRSASREMTMIIKDDGKGFVVDKTSKGNGLANMRHRASDLDGNLSIHSVAGEGTTIQLTVPV